MIYFPFAFAHVYKESCNTTHITLNLISTFWQMTFWVGVSARDRPSKAFSEEGPEKPAAHSAKWQKADSMPALVSNCEEMCPLAPDVPGSANLHSGGESLGDTESGEQQSAHSLARIQENPHSSPNRNDLQVVASSVSVSPNSQYEPVLVRSSSKWSSAASLLRIRLPTGHTGQLL